MQDHPSIPPAPGTAPATVAPSAPFPPGVSPRNGLPPPVATRWKKGQSGNPGGRPKGESITARLRRVLEGEHNGRVLLDLLAERIAKEALSGKHAFVKEVLDRLDGPVNQKREAEDTREVRIIVEDVHGLSRPCASLRELYSTYPAALPPAPELPAGAPPDA
jgi:hypothetical protein